MADQFGISFMPSDETLRQPGQGGPGGPGAPGGAALSPLQEAIRILSLRLPRFGQGAQTPVSPSLLAGPGGASNPQIDAIVEHVLRRVLGVGGPGQGGVGGSGAGPGPGLPGFSFREGPPALTPDVTSLSLPGTQAPAVPVSGMSNVPSGGGPDVLRRVLGLGGPGGGKPSWRFIEPPPDLTPDVTQGPAAPLRGMRNVPGGEFFGFRQRR